MAKEKRKVQGLNKGDWEKEKAGGQEARGQAGKQKTALYGMLIALAFVFS